MNVVESTPYETAKRIVHQFVPVHLVAVDRAGLAEAVRRAIVENANEEVSRRRRAEQVLEGCNLSGVMVVCEEDRTYLRAYNVKSGRWATLPMTEVEG